VARVRADDGTRLFVTDVGSGSTVVLLAGWGFSHAVWREQAVWLSRTHRTVTVDLRGHGGSDAPVDGDYSVARHAKDVDGALEALGVEAAVLVGWSFGGMVAFRLAADRPARVRRLVLVGSNGVATGAHDGFRFGGAADELLAAMLDGERRHPTFRGDVIAKGFARPAAPETVTRLLVDVRQTPSHAGLACFKSLFATVQLDRLGDASTVPLTQIVGDSDAICPLAGAAWLQERFVDARLDILEGVGHYPMFEDPEGFRRALTRALTAGQPSAAG